MKNWKVLRLLKYEHKHKLVGDRIFYPPKLQWMIDGIVEDKSMMPPQKALDGRFQH